MGWLKATLDGFGASSDTIFVRAQAPARASSVISGRVRRGAGRTGVFTRDDFDIACQAVAWDESYRFAGLSAGAYRAAVATTAIGLPPLAVDGTDSVTADLDLPSDDKPIAHYVLFGPAEQPATAVNLLLAQEYLLTFRPAFGFNPVEAAGASTVTIIADEKSVGARIVADLTAGGATVERISGTAAEVAAALTERMARK